MSKTSIATRRSSRGGWKHTKNAKIKISLARSATRHSLETRQKISRSVKRNWLDRKRKDL